MPTPRGPRVLPVADAIRLADRLAVEARPDYRRALALARTPGARDRPGAFESALDQSLGPIASLGAEVGANTVRALVESGDVRRETLKGIRDIPAGIIPGAIGAVTDPKGTAKGMLEQYERTYAPALEGDWEEFRRRMGEKNSGGAVQVLSDGTIVIGGASATLGKLGRRGALGARAKARMTAPRPHLRYSGGPEGVFEQEISPFFFAAGRQRRRDASRGRVEARRRAAAGDRGFRPVLSSRRAPGRSHGYLTGGEVVSRGGLEVRGPRGRGAVIPIPERGARIYGTRTRTGKKQAAREKAQRRILMMQQQQGLDRMFTRAAGLRVGSRIGNLAPSRRGRLDVPTGERALLRYAYGGLVDVTDPKRTVEHLRALRDDIRAGRMARADAAKLFDDDLNVKGPRGRFNDNVRALDMLIEDIEAGDVNLARVAGAARDLRKAEVAIASGRPDFTVPDPGRVSKAQSRRYQPQAVFLSRRGLLPEMREGETGGQFVERVGLRRVIQAAQKEGMLRPGYFPSERRFGQRFADRAIGGSKGLADDRAYRGALFDVGMEDIRPEVLLAGLQRSIKRTHNINLLAEQAQKHAIDLGPPEADVVAAERRIGREEGRQQAAAAREYVRVVDLAHRVREADDGRLELERAMVSSQDFRAEISAAMNSLDGRIETAKATGRLDDWRRLRGEKIELEREMVRAVDQHMSTLLEHERARATIDALELEQDAVRQGMSPGQRAELPKVLEAEAALRAAQEGLRLVRESAPSLTAEALRLAQKAQDDFDRAMEGGRQATRERAGSRAVEAAHGRLARDSLSRQGRTVKELKDDLELAQIDPGHVTLINPGRIYRTYTEGQTAEGKAIDSREERFGRESLEQGDRGLSQALEDGLVDGRQISRMVESDANEFVETGGWMAVPKWVGDEITSGATPEGLFGRVWDVGKGKFSRVLLGLGNVSWLAFQVGSNALLAGLFGHVGPLDMWRAQRWWGRLSDDQRAAIRPILGVSAHHLDFDRKYIGAANANGAIINAKRAFEQTAWWQFARRGNPIDLMFRMDAAQNLVFRRALFYSQAKRRMFERMGESTQDMVGLQDRIVGTLSDSADGQLMRYLDDKPTLELHARKVDELLGDYLTYTKGERMLIQRGIMFYGFVRHSTRLALWTLPRTHPITTAILGKLALLGADEARELLGGDQLPWGLGKFYFRGESGVGRVLDALPLVDIPDSGKVMEIDLARMSPATNAFLDIRTAEQFARIFPPFVSLGIEQIAEKNLNTGKPWLVQGLTQGLPNSQFPFKDYSLMDHLRVAAGQLTRTIPPIRYGERVLFTGPQGDDASIVFGEAPTGFRDEAVVDSIRESEVRLHERSPWQRLAEVAFPFLPRPSDDPRISKDRARRKGESDKAWREHLRDVREGPRWRGGGGDSRLDRFNRSLEPAGGGGGGVDPRLKRFNEAFK